MSTRKLTANVTKLPLLMASVNVLSDVWSDQDGFAWRERIVPLVVGCSLLLCVFAQLLFCILLFSRCTLSFHLQSKTSSLGSEYFLVLSSHGSSMALASILNVSNDITAAYTTSIFVYHR